MQQAGSQHVSYGSSWFTLLHTYVWSKLSRWYWWWYWELSIFCEGQVEGQVFSAYWLDWSLSLLFSGLNSPSSLSLSLYDKCFNASVVFVTLCRTHFGLSHWPWHSRCVPAVLSGGAGSPQPCGNALKWSPGCCWPSLLQGHAAGSCSACPPAPPGLFVQSCFPAGWPPDRTGGAKVKGLHFTWVNFITFLFSKHTAYQHCMLSIIIFFFEECLW